MLECSKRVVTCITSTVNYLRSSYKSLVGCPEYFAGAVKVHIEGDLGWADLFPDSGVACIFLPEAEVINPSACVKEKLAAMAKVKLPGGGGLGGI